MAHLTIIKHKINLFILQVSLKSDQLNTNLTEHFKLQNQRAILIHTILLTVISRRMTN